MNASTYLIVGSSHAALEALNAIRMLDPDGGVTLLTRDARLPYSPTVLPYVVSGHSDPGKVTLRDKAYFSSHGVNYVTGATVASIDPAGHRVSLEAGEKWQYEKLLLATGATPSIPPVEGMDDVSFHVLRTMDDALGLRKAAGDAKSAVVLGAGLIGMHGAENLVRAGLEVTVVEMESQVLPGYFGTDASGLIGGAFADAGVRMLLGDRVTAAAKGKNGKGSVNLTLASGAEVAADLMLVSTGVRAAMSYLEGSGVETDQGILVDDSMATSAADIWAAGDVAQARDFYSADKIVSGIVPSAVETGRAAGMAMIGDPALKPYPGGVPLNTYTFFGQRAYSVGAGALAESGNGLAVERVFDAKQKQFQQIVLKDERLYGISAVNTPMDPGIMWQLILRGVDLGPVMKDFLARPLETGRTLMSRTWR